MKFLSSLIFIIVFHLNASSQILNPVKWTFTKTKIDSKTFEVHLRAIIKPQWHIYSQTQPKNSIAEPLRINFNNNSLLILEGKAIEIGKMSKVLDKSIGVAAWQYSNNLDIVQKVKLKKAGKATIKGFITFQVCNDRQCLPPQDEEFAIVLN